MLIQKYIKELLYLHECVTVPNFGAFLTRQANVLIQPESGIFNPPRKEVSFNSLLKSNDGILVHYMAQREQISFEHALRKIEKEVIVWKQRLNTQQLSFPGIGEMRLNAEKKITFNPYGKINFDLSAFGLKSFIRKPVKTPPLAVKELKPLTIMEKEKKENLMFTPGEQEKERSPFLKYAVIGVIGIALAGSIYYFGDQYLTNERAKSMELAQKKIKSNVQKATFEIGSLAKMDVSLDALAGSAENQPLGRTYYSVIAGSFRSKANAEKKLQQLKEEGFDAAYTDINPVGLHRVAYGRFSSKREALNLHNFVRYSLKEEVWFLAEK